MRESLTPQSEKCEFLFVKVACDSALVRYGQCGWCLVSTGCQHYFGAKITSGW